jgi:hydroxyethylthiazole kinase-like uncharacterized protein yjeF
MKVATSEQMRNIDREAVELYGMPSIVLMENAGIAVSRHIANSISDGGKVCIICGKGNNGGDGFTAARHLFKKNVKIVVYLAGDEDRLKGDALINYNIIKKMGLNIKHIISDDDILNLIDDLRDSNIVVDALLGTGLRGNVSGIYARIIDIINEHGQNVMSVDMPSGIDSDTGAILGKGVMADSTITLALPKAGLYIYPGAEYAGKVFIEDISIPESLIEKQNLHINILSASSIMKMFKKRSPDSNKGTYGRAFIAAGSKDMAGAAVMCIKSALRCGTGIVEAGVPKCIQDTVAPMAMEAIIRGIDEEEGHMANCSIESMLKYINSSTGYAIGPGLTAKRDMTELLKAIISRAEVPGVIDADGLNILAQDIKMLYNAKSAIIVTPHPGEAARLLGRTVKEIQSDRIGWAKRLSEGYGVVAVLKGANTIISSPDGEVFINTTGNPGMAKGGAGDILTGMIVSFLAQGFSPIDAAKCGVYLHGLSGDMASERLGEYGMKAGDIIDFIPAAIKSVSV